MNYTRKIILLTLLGSCILFLINCSGKPQDRTDENEDNQEEYVESFEESDMVPESNKLTVEVIDNTPDEDLLITVFNNLSGRLPYDSTKECQAVLSWNKPRQAIYTIWLLEAEVNNGGFNQFYFNQSKQYYKLLPDALKLIGAPRFAELTQKANDTFEKEQDIITKHQDGTLAGFVKSYDDNPLNKFDDEFQDLYEKENLEKIQIDYIRNNKSYFIDK